MIDDISVFVQLFSVQLLLLLEDNVESLCFSWSTAYEDLLSTNECYPEPIPLTVSRSYNSTYLSNKYLLIP